MLKITKNLVFIVANLLAVVEGYANGDASGDLESGYFPIAHPRGFTLLPQLNKQNVLVDPDNTHYKELAPIKIIVDGIKDCVRNGQTGVTYKNYSDVLTIYPCKGFTSGPIIVQTQKETIDVIYTPIGAIVLREAEHLQISIEEFFNRTSKVHPKESIFFQKIPAKTVTISAYDGLEPPYRFQPHHTTPLCSWEEWREDLGLNDHELYNIGFGPSENIKLLPPKDIQLFSSVRNLKLKDIRFIQLSIRKLAQVGCYLRLVI